jgi:hypothetical protein
VVPDLCIADARELFCSDGRASMGAGFRLEGGVVTEGGNVRVRSIPDVQKSYELRANCYLSKPKAYDEFASLIRGVVDFWLTKAKLPS